MLKKYETPELTTLGDVESITLCYKKKWGSGDNWCWIVEWVDENPGVDLSGG